MVDMEEHVVNDGVLALFPERQINRRDSRTLQSFRHRSLALARKHDMRVWGFMHVGVNVVWPGNNAMGGFPSKILYKTLRIPDVAAHVSMDAYVKHVRDVMQCELDSLLELKFNDVD